MQQQKKQAGLLRVPVKTELLRWACERNGQDLQELLKEPGFYKDFKWANDDPRPTVNQLEKFARKVNVSASFLYLSKPPKEYYPTANFRTVNGRGMDKPSTGLIDTIKICQRRQDWYREYALREQIPIRSYVNSAKISDSEKTVAHSIRSTLGMEHSDKSKKEACLKTLTSKAEDAGILVMKNSIVKNNTRRKLDKDEFRGFALHDPHAPLIFINSSDPETKAAQVFTLAHELAHLWLGKTLFSGKPLNPIGEIEGEEKATEAWCNRVAAELLVPIDRLKVVLRTIMHGENDKSLDASISDILPRLADEFKVSHLVLLLRLLASGELGHEAFATAWEDQHRAFDNSVPGTKKTFARAEYHRTIINRVGHRFIQALVASTIAGETLYRDAFHLLEVKSGTFAKIAAEEMI